MNTLLRWAPAQDHASSASKPFRVGIELGDIRCPEAHPFCPPDEDGPSELDVQRTGANVYTGGTNDH